MTEITRELMYGKRPVRRTNPKPGQSEYYYLDPRGASTFSDMKQIDVPSENSPNPYANEIQNYLYKNDEYNYKQLYGNTPPPPVQTQSNSVTNNYLVPKEVYTDPNWGQQTAAKLDEYMQNYNSYPGVTHTGVAAPFHDMWRNYKTMTDEQSWTGGDNFFHCKANYEAAKRGPWGEIVGKTVSAGREILGQLTGDQLSDLRKDWHANRMGWRGAKKGLSLQQSCPTNPKAYVNPDDYDDIF
ncbi:MAG: hypothetical protein J6N45_01315 [Alphaproteobacteria bacterium]|nr:hypothetical protein [Alphaproteobacteria bacterium]